MQNPGIVCIAFWWSFIVCPTAVVFQVLIIPAFQIEGRICHYVVKIQALVQVICKCRCRAVSRATLSWGAGVLMIVDHRASTGRAYAPSVRVASSKNARIMFSIITQTQINLHPQSPFYHSPCPKQCHRLKEIFPTVQNYFPFGTKTLFLQSKNIFLTVQKDSPFSLRLCFCQPPS